MKKINGVYQIPCKVNGIPMNFIFDTGATDVTISLVEAKFLIKQGLNPRCNILLVLKDKREIPLFPAQFLLNPIETEKKAIKLSTFLNVPLENLII